MSELRQTLPDYSGNGLVNLMASLERSLADTPGGEAPLQRLDVLSLCRGKHVVLLVIDGLGYNTMRASNAPTLNGMQSIPITTVFPSTTASAITTYLTGLSPRAHGNIGWFLYSERLGEVFCPLPFTRRSSGALLTEEDIEPSNFFGYSGLAERLPCTTYSFAPQAIAFSPFNRYHTTGASIRPYARLRAVFDDIVQTVKQARSRTFVYAYYPEIDRLGHQHGIGSEEVAASLANLDTRIGQFLEKLAGTDTAVLVTADHGFVDPPQDKRLFLPDYPTLKGLLTQPLCGEPRAAYCHVQPSREDEFAAAVEAELGGCLDLSPSAQVLEEGLLGPGEPHPELASRLGEFTLIMREDYSLSDTMADEERPELRGVHGGLSEDEMLVPLCVVTP